MTKRPVGELSNRIGELENIRKFLTGTALTAVLDAVFALLYVFVMIIYSWQLTLVTVAVIPALIGVTYYFSPKVRKQIQAKSVAAAKTQSHLVEVLSGIQTVKSQGIELRTRWKWQDLYVDYVSDGFGNTVIGTANNSISTLINKTSSLMVVWMGAALVVEGKMTMGGMIAFRMIAGFCNKSSTKTFANLAKFSRNQLIYGALGRYIKSSTRNRNRRTNKTNGAES